MTIYARLAALTLLSTAACGRVDFDPIVPPGDGASPAVDGTAVACNGAMNGCNAQGTSLSNSTSGNVSNDLAMFADNFQGPCGGAGGGDYGVSFMVMQTGTYRFSVTAGFDTVLYAIDGSTCTGTSLGCNDTPGAGGDQLDLALTVGQQIEVVVDSKGECGPFQLNFQGI